MCDMPARLGRQAAVAALLQRRLGHNRLVITVVEYESTARSRLTFSRRKELLNVKSRGKSIEFEKGKAAIAVPSLDKLPAVIDTLIAATRDDELDAQLAQGIRPPPVRKR